jgi:hypothetical protein
VSRQTVLDRPRPRILATLRNLAFGLIRQAGYTKIAATIRLIKYDTTLLLAILGLEKPLITSTKDFAAHPGVSCGVAYRSPHLRGWADSNVMDMAAAAIANCQAWFPAPAGIGRAVLAPPGTSPVVDDPLEKV